MIIRRLGFLCAAALCLGIGAAPVGGADPGPSGPTAPPMGWNSWNSGIALNEQTIRQTIDAMVDSGMRDAGYLYVNLDAGWAAPARDAAGALRADPARFPHGIAALAGYAHARGLRFGLYSSPYNQICGQTPAAASLGHEEQDARTFAAWGVDYLKYDWCATATDHGAQVRIFGAMRDALRHSGRHIVYSINPNSSADDHAGVRYDWSGIADLARNTSDLIPLWHNPIPPVSVNGQNFALTGVDGQLTAAEQVARRSRPGYWNDPDMLVVGITLPEFFGTHLSASAGFAANSGVISAADADRIGQALQLPPQTVAQLRGRPSLSLDEQRAQLSLWAMLAAPLLAGNDVRAMPVQTRELLTNREVLAIDQDQLVAQAHSLPSDARVLVKPLAGGDVAVAFVNAADQPTAIETTTAAVGLGTRVTVRDVWARTTAGTGPLRAIVPAHGVTLLRVSPGDGAAPRR